MYQIDEGVTQKGTYSKCVQMRTRVRKEGRTREGVGGGEGRSEKSVIKYIRTK